MKTFKQFLEQTQLPSNYTDYKAPAVQAAHARGMQSASKMRQMGMNAKAIDPKDEAQANLDNVKSGSGVVKPLSGTTIRSGVGKGFKVGGGSSGVQIRQEQWYANPTSRTENGDESTTTTFTTPDGNKVKVRQTKAERERDARINQQNQPKPGEDTLW
jgi:hypothetical protein